MILYIGKSDQPRTISSNNFKKITKYRRQEKFINNHYSEFSFLYSKKNNWSVTFKEELVVEEISLWGQSHVFVLVPEDIGQLLSYLSYFLDCKLLRPWICAALIYDFYSSSQDIENIVEPANCKVFRRREIEKLSGYITSIEECLVEL